MADFPFAGEMGGDFVLLTHDKGTGQLMATIRSINAGAETAVLVVRENWDLTTPNWTAPSIVVGTVTDKAPSILGPLGSGRVVIVYVDSSGNLDMTYTEDGGKTWN